MHERAQSERFHLIFRTLIFHRQNERQDAHVHTVVGERAVKAAHLIQTELNHHRFRLFDNLLQQVAHNRLQGHNLGWLTGLDIEEDAFDRFHRLPVHRRSRRGWRWRLVALRSRRLCRSRGRLLFDDCRTRLRRRGCAHVQSALRIDGDDVNAVPFELNNVVGVGDQPFVEQKRRSVPGLIEARDKHADRELINGNAFSRVHIRVRLKPRRDGVVGKRYRYVQLSRNIYR